MAQMAHQPSVNPERHAEGGNLRRTGKGGMRVEGPRDSHYRAGGVYTRFDQEMDKSVYSSWVSIRPAPLRNPKTLQHLLEPRVRLQRVKLFADRKPETHILAPPLIRLLQRFQGFLPPP